MPMSKILPVIMCGGAGTRVWPESRETCPKQFIPLVGDALDLPGDDPARHRADVRAADRHHQSRLPLPRRGAARRDRGAPPTIVTEPVRRDSGPAVAVAATLAAAAGAGDDRRGVRGRPRRRQGSTRFVEVCAKAAKAAADGYIVTLGIKPTEPADRLRLHPARRDASATGVHAVERLRREARPGDGRALRRRAAISGIPAISSSAPTPCWRSCRRSSRRWRAPPRRPVAAAKTDLGFLALDAATFGASPKKSIDYAVMERTKRAAVVPADIGWSDVGNWDAVWKLSDRDADGNSFHGEDAFALDRQNVARPLGRHADRGGRRQRRDRRDDAGRRAGARRASRATRSRSSSRR